MGRTLYLGSWVHSLSIDHLEYVEKGIISVDQRGIIEWIEKDVEISNVQDIAMRYGLQLDDPDLEVIELSSEEFLCPGLIDTHTVCTL